MDKFCAPEPLLATLYVVFFGAMFLWTNGLATRLGAAEKRLCDLEEKRAINDKFLNFIDEAERRLCCSEERRSINNKFLNLIGKKVGK